MRTGKCHATLDRFTLLGFELVGKLRRDLVMIEITVQVETRSVAVSDVMPIPVPPRQRVRGRAGTPVQTIKGTSATTGVY